MKFLILLCSLFTLLTYAQPSTDGMFFDGIDDNITVPNTSYINSTTTNNRTYETYFKVNSTTSRQILMKEGAGTRGVIIYVENGFLVLGAYNRADYTPKWEGTYYRTPILENTWYHIALIFDNAQPANSTTNPMTESANSALKFYLNGVLYAQYSGFQLGGHNSIRLGYKNESLRFPDCSNWVNDGLIEYCFGELANDNGGDEYYLNGNLWGFRIWNDVRSISELNNNKDVIITTIGSDNLVAYLDGDTFSYIASNGIDSQVDNQFGSNPKIWSSNATSSDWNNPSNWVGNAVPEVAKLESATIQPSLNYPIINSNIVVGDITIATGASITIDGSGTLDVVYDLINDGVVTLENNGSLLTRESKAIEGIGNFIVKRDSPNYNNSDFYSIWSTPVLESDSQLSSIFGNQVISYRYDVESNQYVALSGDYNLVPSQAYFIRPDNESGILTRIFDGTVNNGTLSQDVFYNISSDNFQLIGNPYPSALNWIEFQKNNSELISGTMYFWNQSTVSENNSAADYISFNSTGSNIPGTTGNIATAQGVFVKSVANGTIKFKNTQRVSGNNNQFYRSSNTNDSNKSWFKLQGDNGFDSILVGFLPNATNGFDDDYDAKFINDESNIELYSYIENERYSIQGLSELTLNENVSMPIGFQVTSSGNYTFSILQEYINHEFDILLEDTKNNALINLRIEDYNFHLSNPIEDNTRFILHFVYNQTLNVESSNIEKTKVYVINDLLKIRNTMLDMSNLKVIIYSIDGKEILLSKSSNIDVSNLREGIYIVNVNIAGRKINKKIILN